MISSDNSKLDTDSFIISTQSLREQASKWNLGNDVSLLQHLQGVSSKILGEISSLQKDLTSLSKEALSTAVKVDNVAQTFNLLSSNQYIESRVYDDDDEKTSSKVPAHQSKPEMSREEKEEAMIPKIRQVLLIGMGSLKPSQSAVEQNNKQHFAMNLEYDSRPLPYLIGSAEFLQHPTAGLATSYQEKDQKEERMKESKRVIDEQTVLDGLSVSLSTSVSIDSDDDTHQPQVAAVPSMTEEIARILKPGFERVKSSSLFEEPSLTSQSLAHEIGKEERAKDSLCESEDLFVSEEAKRSTIPLFNENEDTDTDEDLFHPKTTARKTAVIANGKKPSGGVSMLGAANPSILIHSKQPEDQSVPPPSPKSQANSSVTASQPSKPTIKPLFDDDEEDLFASLPAFGQLSKPLPRTAPPPAPSVTERQVAPVKPAVSISALVQPVKKQTLFGDSDSEDDLFAPIKPVAIPRRAKPRETESPKIAEGNPKTPAVAPRTQVESISKEIQPAASPSSEAVFEDDEDDLFSTKSDMPKSAKLRVKSALSSAITPIAVQPIFETQESTSAPRSTRPRSKSPPNDKEASVLPKNFNSPAISIQKPVISSNLFEDSDDDLFARVTSRKPTFNPKVSPSVVPTTQKPEKNGEWLTVKPAKNLFESDDEDDLFAQASPGKSQPNTRASEQVPAISDGTTQVPEIVTTVIPPTPSSPDVTNPNSKLTDYVFPASSVLENSTSAFPSQSETFGVGLPSSGEREDIGGSLTETKADDYPSVSSNTKKNRTPLPGLEVSPVASPRESGSDVSDVERPSRKPVGGVALFSGALFLDAKLKSRQISRESPVSVSPLESGDSWPVFSPSPASNGPSFEGPSDLDGPSSKLLPTVIKARAKIVAKRKPPSKRFREQGLQHQKVTTDQPEEYGGNEVEGPRAAEITETAIPEADIGAKMESLFEFSNEENLSFKLQEKDIAIVSEKLYYDVSSTLAVSREGELKNETCTVDSIEKNAKTTNLPEGDIPAHDGELRTDAVQITDVIKPVMTLTSAKVATLFESDEDDDLFAPNPISPRSVSSSKPIAEPAEVRALPSSLQGHEENRSQSTVRESSRSTGANVLFHVDEDTSDDDLFAASSASGKLTETSQTTPQESQESRETSKQIVRDQLKAKATKPKLSATFFEDDSDEDLFSSKSSKGKFASVSKTTTPILAPKKGSAPFKDPLLGSP